MHSGEVGGLTWDGWTCSRAASCWRRPRTASGACGPAGGHAAELLREHGKVRLWTPTWCSRRGSSPNKARPRAAGYPAGCQQPLPLIVGQEADQALRRFLGLGDLQNRVVLGLLPRPLQGLHPRMLHVDRLGRIEDFRFHDLRHSAASYMLMNGASIAELAEVLGHKTPQMVKRCSHLSESRTKGIVERINRPSPGRLPMNGLQEPAGRPKHAARSGGPRHRPRHVRCARRHRRGVAGAWHRRPRPATSTYAPPFVPSAATVDSQLQSAVPSGVVSPA